MEAKTYGLRNRHSPLSPFQCPLRGAEPLREGEPHENDRTGHESDHEEPLPRRHVDLSFSHPGRTSIHQCIVTTSADHDGRNCLHVQFLPFMTRLDPVRLEVMDADEGKSRSILRRTEILARCASKAW